MPSLREVIRGTPTILVVNKCDLLPRLDMHDLRYLQRRLERRGVRDPEIYSAILYSAICSARVHLLPQRCTWRFTRRFTRRFRAQMRVAAAHSISAKSGLGIAGLAAEVIRRDYSPRSTTPTRRYNQCLIS